MSDFQDYHAIKIALENELCPVHNRQADIEVTPNGFQFSSCCKEFNADLTSKATKMAADQVTAAAINTIKNALK